MKEEIRRKREAEKLSVKWLDNTASEKELLRLLKLYMEVENTEDGKDVAISLNELNPIYNSLVEEIGIINTAWGSFWAEFDHLKKEEERNETD